MKNEFMMREAPMRKVFLQMCLPSVIIMIVMVIYNMADIYFVGQTGDAAQVAAISLAGPVFSILSAIGTLVGAGGGTAVAIALGKGEKSHIRAITSFCFYATLLVSVIFMIVMQFFYQPIVAVLGADAYTVEYTATYVRILAFSSPFVLCSSVFANVIRADGSVKQAMIANLLGTVVHIIMDPILISMLNMGVAGAALATAAGNVVSCCYLLVYIARKQSYISFSIHDLRLKADTTFRVLLLGLPMSISVMLMSISSVFSNNLLASYGTQAVAANGVMGKIGMLISMIVMGICMGVQPAISYNYGAGNLRRMREIVKKTLWFSIGVGAILTLACSFFREQFIAAFIDQADVVALGQKMVVATLIIAPIYGIYQTCTVFLQGTGKVSYAIALSVLRQGLLYVPILYLSNRLYGLDGLIFAASITEVVAILIAIVLSTQWNKQIA